MINQPVAAPEAGLPPLMPPLRPMAGEDHFHDPAPQTRTMSHVNP